MAEATGKKCQCYLSMKTDLNSSVLSCFLKLFKEADLELGSKATRDLMLQGRLFQSLGA